MRYGSAARCAALQRFPSILPILCVLAAATAPDAAPTARPDPTIKLAMHPPGPQHEAIFGYAVAAAGPNALVGAPHTPVDGRMQAGAAYLLDGTSGAILRTFLDPARRIDDLFGHAVAGTGDRVLIGAPRTAVYGLPMAGAAYLFDASTGRLLRAFYEPTPSANAEFGSTVAFVDGQPLIASPAATVGGAPAAGCAYLFDVSSGRLLRTFSAQPAPVAHEIFALTATQVGGAVLFGAPHATVAGEPRAGAAYLLDAESGALVRRYTAPTAVAESLFGAAIVSTRSVIAIGAPYAPDGEAERSGAVYVYDRESGTLLHTLREPVTDRNDRLFGFALAAACGHLLVGAPHASPDGRWLAGLAYLFEATTGQVVGALREPTPTERSGFGIAVASLNDRPLVGAERARTATGHGAAYLFDCAPAASNR